MYRQDISNRDRTGVIALVAAIHVGLAFVLMNAGGTFSPLEEQPPIEIFDISDPEPPKPLVEIKEEREKPKEKEGEAAPPNIKSQATPVVRPEPKVEVPAPPVITAAPTPNTGAAPTQGAAPVPGPGTGAGGVGTGTGSGGSGAGTGGGGGGGRATRAGLIRGITNRDYPAAIQRSWPRGGRIFLRLRIEANGRPSKCDVMRSYGDRSADEWTCSLLMSRGVFRPATDDDGKPVSAWFGYIQSDQGRFDR